MRTYGWKPDPPDARDRYAKKVPLMRRVMNRFPDKFDLTPLCTPVEQQGALGSCVAHGIIAAMELIDHAIDDRYVDLSRLFGYWIIRENKEVDSGAYIRDAIKAFAKHGICEEAFWKYDIERFNVTPSESAFHDAYKRKFIEYYRIPDDDRKYGIMATLYDKKVAVIFGFIVYKNFDVPEVSTAGMMTMPSPDDLAAGALGGHCVDIVGWENIGGKFYWKCRNSYGSDWGVNGYFWMPEAYVLDTELSSDFWVVSKIPHPMGTEPFEPDFSDAKWYLPITTIWRVIKTGWDWIAGRKPQYRRKLQWRG